MSRVPGANLPARKFGEICSETRGNFPSFLFEIMALSVSKRSA
jgi:hypothetical protein